jgi:hypothetical protein
MIAEDKVGDFVTLFRGRGDCYGSWEGGCVREPLTFESFANHLERGPHIGVYPCVTASGKTLCVWGCSDIDYDEPAHAWILADALSHVGVTAWVEKTARGYHVWVFATELTPASDMRRMFLAAHKVVDLPPKEVNPKQETLERGQVGNYVRLPYPNIGSGKRVMVNRDGSPISFDDFIASAIGSRINPERVGEIAKLYKAPTVEARDYGQPSADLASTVRSLSVAGRAIYRDGPLEGRDRSTTLVRLAYECKQANIHPADALRILEDADLRWGKYMARGERGHVELEKLLVRAYGRTPSS